MTNAASQPQGVHLVGSVPLKNSRAVFETASSILGTHLHRMPDGETGERTNWISWQFEVLASTPQLEIVEPRSGNYGRQVSQVKLRDGFAADQITFGALGYSAAAMASYAEFAEMKRLGLISAECRFQLCLPTPIAPLQFYVVMDDRKAIEPYYEAKLLGELDEVLAAIPADQLAIQWDTAVEFGILEGVFPSYFHNAHEEILERLARLGDAVPDGVELGYHLCYGDSGHRHFVEPQDAGKLVEIANGIAAKLSRSLNWIHLPVPRNRDDQAFFQPLAALTLHPETELYLGLVHMTDGIEGANRRIRAAQAVIDTFGVATECGFGRRPPETVPKLMRIHTAISASL